MTTVSPAEPSADAAPDRADAVAEPPPARQRRVTWRGILFVAILVPAALAVPFLAYTGATILRDEDTGRVVDVTGDVDAPGFEALVTPTPTQLVVMLGPDGRVAGVQVLALTDPSGGGSVVSAPVATHLEVDYLDRPTQPLDVIYDTAGLADLEQRIEALFAAGMGEVVQVGPEQWAGLLGPVGTLTVENPSAFTGVRPDGTLGPSFEAGPVELTPDLVADFLLLRGEGEVDTARNDRQIAFWQSWVQAVADGGGSLVPGESEQGLGRFVQGLAEGMTAVTPLPVDQVPVPGAPVVDANVFRPRQDEVAELSLRAIPFPVGVGRLRTRLLDGVGDVEGLKARAASTLVAAGAEITVIGNAEEFGQPETTVVFFRPADREAARALADAVGGRLERGEIASETVDAVVLIGRDFADAEEAGVGDPGEGGGSGPPTSVPIGGDEATPGIAPGVPGGGSGG